MSNTPSRGASFLNAAPQRSEEAPMPPRAYIPDVYGYDNPAPQPAATPPTAPTIDGMTPEMQEWLRQQMMAQMAPRGRADSRQGQNQTQSQRENWTTADRDAWRAQTVQDGGINGWLARADGYLQDNPAMIAGIASGMPGGALAMHQAGRHFGGNESNPVTGSGWINPDTARQLRMNEVTYGVGDPRNSMMRNPSSGGGGSSNGGGGMYDPGREWSNPDTGRTHY